MIEYKGYKASKLRQGDIQYIIDNYATKMRTEIVKELHRRGCYVTVSAVNNVAKKLGLSQSEELKHSIRQRALASRMRGIDEWKRRDYEGYMKHIKANLSKANYIHYFTKEELKRGAESMRKSLRMERTRMALGLETKLKRKLLLHCNKGLYSAKFVLRRRGYITTEGHDCYILPCTNRNERLERKYNDLFNITFMPIAI